MRVLFLSHTHGGGDFVVGSHHLAREFVRSGHEVLHVSTPVSMLHRLVGRAGSDRLEAARRGTYVADGVAHLVPRTLLPAELNWGRSLREILRNFRPDVVILDQPKMMSRSLSRSRVPIIYRPTDTYLRGLAAARQSQAVAVASGVVCTSEEVERMLPRASGQPRIVLRNGVEWERFRSDIQEGRSGVIYVGALDHRFDWAAVAELGRSLPEVSVLLYGPAGPPTIALPDNVRLAGAAAYRDLPGLLESSKVGLIPLSASAENRGRSPMKLFEYLAAGLWVVARRTEALGTDTPPGVSLYETAEQLVEQVRERLLEPGANDFGRAQARREDWKAKSDLLLEFLLAVVGEGR